LVTYPIDRCHRTSPFDSSIAEKTPVLAPMYTVPPTTVGLANTLSLGAPGSGGSGLQCHAERRAAAFPEVIETEAAFADGCVGPLR
jgi:hypothetical protein